MRSIKCFVAVGFKSFASFTWFQAPVSAFVCCEIVRLQSPDGTVQGGKG